MNRLNKIIQLPILLKKYKQSKVYHFILDNPTKLSDQIIILIVLNAISNFIFEETFNNLYEIIKKKIDLIIKEIIANFEYSFNFNDNCDQCIFFQWIYNYNYKLLEYKKIQEYNKKLKLLNIKDRVYNVFFSKNNIKLYKQVCNKLLYIDYIIKEKICAVLYVK
jgi:hypothetical protein